MSEKMSGFKGFNEKLQCTPAAGKVFQYEVGKEYKEDKACLCGTGLHFCENPIDVFGYYPPSDSRYCEIEAEDVCAQIDDDSKRCAKKIKIGTEIGITGIIDAFIKFTFEKIDWNNKDSNTGYYSAATNTGYYSAATNTGYYSAATNTGDQSAATNTGYQSAAIVEGQESVAISLGIEGKAKGKKGCFLVLAEWKQDENFNWHRKTVKSSKIDGKRIKEDVFYALKDGKFVEVD